MNFSLYRLLALTLLPLALAACGSSTDSSSPSGAQLSGSVVKGITANAVVTITAPDGKLLATTVSDAQGAFSATLPAGFAGAVLVTATASVPPATPTTMRCDAPSGCVDANNSSVAYGNWFNVPADFRMSAVAAVDGSGIHLVNLTPLSTLAATWAAQFPQGLDAQSANTANAEVAAMFGMALSDLQQPTGDITNPQWTKLADPKQLQLALIYATFAEIAKQNNITQQNVIDTLASLFADQQGRLLQASSTVSTTVNNIASLLFVTTTVAGTIDMPAASLADVQAAMASLQSTLQADTFTASTPVSYSDMIAKLGPMGTQIDQVLNITGLIDPKQFIVDKTPLFAWLLSPDNLQIAPLGVETVLYSLLGSAEMDLLPAGTTSVVLVDDGVSTITLDLVAKTLTVAGTRYGQQVNLVVNLTDFMSGVAAKQFNFGINGTVVNATASGEIHGTLVIDTGTTNFQPVISAVIALGTGSTTAGAQLQTAIHDLAYSANGNVTLSGNAQLVNNANTALVFGGDVSLTAAFNLGATTGQTIASLNVSAGDLVLPDGSHLYGLVSTPILTATLGDDATATVDGAGVMLGLPEAFLHASGKLVNARSLFDYARTTLLNGLSTGTLDIPTLIAAIKAYDYTQLALTGDGSITIPSLNQEYRAHLDNLTATVYQPHSTDVALTATLDIPDQKIHFMIGVDPWDLRMMMTPTPRLVLVGPDGQFVEATQEDLYTFLNDIPLGNLVSALVP